MHEIGDRTIKGIQDEDDTQTEHAHTDCEHGKIRTRFVVKATEMEIVRSRCPAWPLGHALVHA